MLPIKNMAGSTGKLHASFHLYMECVMDSRRPFLESLADLVGNLVVGFCHVASSLVLVFPFSL